VGDLDPPPSGQVAVEVEFLLQLQRLVPRVWCPLTFSFSIGVYRTWEYKILHISYWGFVVPHFTISHLRLRYLSSLFIFRFRNKSLYAFIFLIPGTCPNHTTFLHSRLPGE
jgi:hypothetical protein